MTECTCACQGANLDKFIQPIILKVLSDKKCTRYQVRKEIGNYITFKEDLPDTAGVYRYISSLEERGMVKKYDNNGQQLFAATKDGNACLDNWIRTLHDYEKIIKKLTDELEK